MFIQMRKRELCNAQMLRIHSSKLLVIVLVKVKASSEVCDRDHLEKSS